MTEPRDEATGSSGNGAEVLLSGGLGPSLEGGAPSSAAGGGPSSEADESLLDLDEIDALVGRRAAGSGHSSHWETERLLNRAEADLAAALGPDPRSLTEAARPFEFQPFDSDERSNDPQARLESLEDVELDLRIELGRTELLIEEVLKLKPGSVVPLDKLAGDPVDVLVNGRLVARGEVLVLNDNFCVRIAEILAPDF